MNSPFPKVRLGSFLRHRKEFFTLDDTARYKRVRVQLHNKGVVLRDIVHGAELKTKKQQEANTGELLVAEIDAKVGGFGIVPPELEAAIVSGHYFLYEIDESKCLRGWLDSFIRAGGLEEQVRARGSTNYAAIRPEHILDFEIPLPPLPEQRRIVARIEELAAKLDEACRLRYRARNEMDTLLPRACGAVFGANRWPEAQLGDLLREDSQNGLAPRPSPTPPGTPILRISAATSRRDAIIDESDYRYLEVSQQDAAKYSLEPGDLLACRFNGNLHFVGRFALYRGNLGEGRLYPDKLIRFRVNRAKVLPEFVRFALNSPRYRPAVESFCATTAGNIGISASDLKKVPVPVPPIGEQLRIIGWLDSLQACVDALTPLQDEASVELDLLIPSLLDRAFRGEMI